MEIIILFFLIIGIYCILAQALTISPFSVSASLSPKKVKTTNILSIFINTASLSIAQFIPISMVHQIQLSKTLKAAAIDKTPQQYVAKLCVISMLMLPAVVVSFLINLIFGMVLLAVCILTIAILYNDAKSIGRERYRAIENDLPNFISNFVNCIKTNRNVIEIIDTYRRGYDNELTKELAITVADMRTGVPELALQRLEARLDISLFSELIRGVLSTMHGEDMTVYFNNLMVKSNEAWRQRLTKQAFKVKPKISVMSLSLAAYSIVALIVVFVQTTLSEGGLML